MRDAHGRRASDRRGDALIQLYERLVARCETVNELNRVHIHLEARLTPSQLSDIQEHLAAEPGYAEAVERRRWERRAERAAELGREALHRARQLLGSKGGPRRRPRTTLTRLAGLPLPLQSWDWCERLDGWAGRSGKDNPEPFVRRRVAPGISLYHTDSSRDGRLLVAFTGRFQRMMMPLPTFLQHVSASDHDVLVLSDSTRNGFRKGIVGLADSFEGVVERLSKVVDRARYSSVVTFGVSGGGLPAILTCLMLSLDKGVSVGGNGPEDPRWLSAAGRVIDTLDDAVAARPEPANLLLVFGADHEQDRASAASLGRRVHADVLEVRGPTPGARVRHNALHPLLLGAKLSGFLGRALDPDLRGFSQKGGGGSNGTLTA